MHPRRTPIVALSCSLAWLSGCASNTHTANPSFPLEMKQAETLLDHMHAQPKPLQRPAIVIGGIYDPGFQSGSMAREIRHVNTTLAGVVHQCIAII